MPTKPLSPGLVLLLLVTGALADSESDALKLYKKHLGQIVARERTYEARTIEDDLRAANETYRAPWRQRGGPEAPKVIDYDFSGYDAVYERWAGYAEEKGDLALSLADVGGAKIADKLISVLLDTLTEIQRQHQQFPESRPKTRSIHDQLPGIKRYAAWVHRDMLVQAIGKLTGPKAVHYILSKGWKKAERWDRGKKTAMARAAILDAMARPEWKDNREVLDEASRSEEPHLRIAAFEALAAQGASGETTTRLKAAAVGDPCWSVRVAVGELLDEKKPEATEGGPAFCGVPIASERVILVLDASYMTVKPVDVELLKTRAWREWRSVSDKERNWIRQVDLLREQGSALVNSLPPKSVFNLIIINEGNRVLPLNPKGMVKADGKGRRAAEEFLGEVLPGGWAPQLHGLWEACRIAGADPYRTEIPDEPGADTIVLYSNGVPRGGQLLYGPAVVDDVKRSFRWNRIRIHTVRVDDAAEPAEEVMKGIAEVTGGTYLHRTEP